MLDALKLFRERQSNRDLHDSGRMIAREDLLLILEAARWAPTPHNMQNLEILIVDDRKLLERIIELRSLARAKGFVEEEFWNVDAYTHSEEELRRKKVGFLVRAHTDEKTRSIERALQDKEYVKTSPVLGILLYNPDKKPPNVDGGFLNAIGLGCVLENVWLMSNSLEISFQALSCSGLIGETEREMKRILNIPEELKIALIFRLGYAIPTTEKRLRVRRDVGDFTHYNRFGNKYVSS